MAIIALLPSIIDTKWQNIASEAALQCWEGRRFVVVKNGGLAQKVASRVINKAPGAGPIPPTSPGSAPLTSHAQQAPWVDPTKQEPNTLPLNSEQDIKNHSASSVQDDLAQLRSYLSNSQIFNDSLSPTLSQMSPEAMSAFLSLIEKLNIDIRSKQATSNEINTVNVILFALSNLSNDSSKTNILNAALGLNPMTDHLVRDFIYSLGDQPLDTLVKAASLANSVTSSNEVDLQKSKVAIFFAYKFIDDEKEIREALTRATRIKSLDQDRDLCSLFISCLIPDQKVASSWEDVDFLRFGSPLGPSGYFLPVEDFEKIFTGIICLRGLWSKFNPEKLLDTGEEFYNLSAWIKSLIHQDHIKPLNDVLNNLLASEDFSSPDMDRFILANSFRDFLNTLFSTCKKETSDEILRLLEAHKVLIIDFLKGNIKRKDLKKSFAETS